MSCIIAWDHLSDNTVFSVPACPPPHLTIDDMRRPFIDINLKDNGHVYACTNAGWTGRCQNMYFTANQCLNFPSDLQDNISSIGPDGGWLCLAYEDINCSGYSFYVQKPGESDLSTRSDGVNDQLSSIACWWTGVGA
ncbi:hypothetical protein BC629DRAFT_1598323 [Irpex lacteus]|nr:hypothetical protein BC629DRAFT_1598323 [Irpex lacteus]